MKSKIISAAKKVRFASFLFFAGVCIRSGGADLLPIEMINTIKATKSTIYSKSCSFPSSLIPSLPIKAERSVMLVAYKKTASVINADKNAKILRGKDSGFGLKPADFLSVRAKA